MKINVKFFKKIIPTIIATSLILSACSSNNETSDNQITNNSPNKSSFGKSNLELTDELKEKIISLNEAADEYYLEKWSDLKFLSIFSYFYDENYNEISISEIAKNSNVDLSEDLSNQISVHFLKPEIILNYVNSGINESDKTIMTVYTAVNTKDGIFLSSKYDEGILLSFNDYRKIVLSHSQENGPIKEGKNKDKIFDEIMNKISSYSTSINNYDVKHFKYDNKYAVVVATDELNPSNIVYSLLEKNEENWEIINSNLSTTKIPRQNINYNYPTVSMNLLPKYSIAELGEIGTNYPDFVNQIISTGLLSKESLPVTYTCGAGKFVYFEFKDDSKVVGYANENNELECYEINNTNEAEKIMLNFDPYAPLFIINYRNNFSTM